MICQRKNIAFKIALLMRQKAINKFIREWVKFVEKFLEIQEFDCITCNEDYKESDAFKYLEKEIFEELENFILSFKDNGEAEAVDFLKIGSMRNAGKYIQAKNFVGLIQMKSGFQIQILPKIYFSDANDTKKIFLRMLRSLKDFPSKIFNDAGLKMDRMNLYEIFINMYIQEVRNIVKKGIKSAYLPVENNENYYKGKLVVKEQIRKNSVHKERFFIAYDEFNVNRPENRLIKSTLLKLQNISSNVMNIKELRQLLTNFEMIKPSNNYIKDFFIVVIDRNTKDYEVAMRWSKVFLMNQSFTTFSGNTTARALLFPMEKIFESYVAKYLKKALVGVDCDISLQDKGFYLFDSPKKFALRPDIVITRCDGSRIILDTKWKSLINNPRKNYGISQGDMYQMYAYSKKYKTSEIWLLYPLNENMQSTERIKFKSEVEDNVLVSLFFINVANIENSLDKLKLLLKLEMEM
jgi:5-methylcytosine-specific restriction enzyme subunit McrC